MGTVDDPTKEEWSEAYYAPSRPYRWDDGPRVTPRGGGTPHVIRATGGPRCECYSRRGRLVPGEYERIPGDIMAPLKSLDGEARDELAELADFVGHSDLCSGLLPLFVRGIEEHCGRRHSEAVHEVIDRIRRIDSIGLHMSPGVVAKILGDFAARGRMMVASAPSRNRRPKDPGKASKRRHRGVAGRFAGRPGGGR